MGIIPTRVHAMIDYAFGVLLIIAPWLFGFAEENAETWVPVFLGAGVIFYSLFTAYELGIVPAISMPTHLGLDVVGGIFLAASPWIFQFADLVWVPHVVLGLIEIGTALMTQVVPSRMPYPTGQHRQTGVR